MEINYSFIWPNSVSVVAVRCSESSVYLKTFWRDTCHVTVSAVCLGQSRWCGVASDRLTQELRPWKKGEESLRWLCGGSAFCTAFHGVAVTPLWLDRPLVNSFKHLGPHWYSLDACARSRFAFIWPQSSICRKVTSANRVTRCTYELPSEGWG